MSIKVLFLKRDGLYGLIYKHGHDHYFGVK